MTITIENLFQLARTQHQNAQWLDAERSYLQVLRQQPRHAESLYWLGLLNCQIGHLSRGLELLQFAIQLTPECGSYCHVLGGIYRQCGDLEQAEKWYRKALTATPKLAIAWHDLGNLKQQQNKSQEAIALLRQALKLDPSLAIGWNNLGNILQQQGENESALTCYQMAHEYDPECPGINYNMGILMLRQERWTAGFAYFRRHLQINPGDVNTMTYLAFILGKRGQIVEALPFYQQILKQVPTQYRIHSEMLFWLRAVPGISEKILFQEFQNWATIHASGFYPKNPVFTNERKIKRRLRIGYISSCFASHSVAPIFELLFTHHDRNRVEIILFSDVGKPDHITQRFQNLADEWVHIFNMVDDGLCREIKQRKIDILVDLNGHTQAHRLLVFARQPAPIQVTGLGLGHTTGLKTMNYRLSDRYLTPAKSIQYNTETIINLTSMMRFIPPAINITPGPPACIKNGYITFGCGNDLFKINSQILDTWATILLQLPDSHLAIKAPTLTDIETVNYYRILFQQRNISPQRIHLLGATPQRKHLAWYNTVDIALDPFPYNGGATILETTWMGVPTITLAGGTRTGCSILNILGCPELIADSQEEYIHQSINLAKNQEQIQMYHSQLRPQLLSSPLCDGQQFACEVEDAYWNMWQKWCELKSGG